MALHQLFRIRAALVVALVVVVLAGCASDSRSGQAVDWVVSQEGEKKRLDDAGFPQYSGAM